MIMLIGPSQAPAHHMEGASADWFGAQFVGIPPYRPWFAAPTHGCNAGTATAVGLHQYDTHVCYSRFNRNMRSLGAFIATVVDYKFRYDGTSLESIAETHDRVATRWCARRSRGDGLTTAGSMSAPRILGCTSSLGRGAQHLACPHLLPAIAVWPP